LQGAHASLPPYAVDHDLFEPLTYNTRTLAQFVSSRARQQHLGRNQILILEKQTFFFSHFFCSVRVSRMRPPPCGRGSKLGNAQFEGTLNLGTAFEEGTLLNKERR